MSCRRVEMIWWRKTSISRLFLRRSLSFDPIFVCFLMFCQKFFRTHLYGLFCLFCSYFIRSVWQKARWSVIENVNWVFLANNFTCPTFYIYLILLLSDKMDAESTCPKCSKRDSSLEKENSELKVVIRREAISTDYFLNLFVRPICKLSLLIICSVAKYFSKKL